MSHTADIPMVIESTKEEEAKERQETGYTLAELRDGLHIEDIKVLTGDSIAGYHQRKAYENAIELLSQWGSDNLDMEYHMDWWKEQAAERGWNDLSFYYSIGYSQGDGVSIIDGYLDVRKWLKFHRKSNVYRAIFANADDITVLIVRKHGGGVHEWGTVEVDYTGEQAIYDYDNYIANQGLARLDTPLARQLADFEDDLANEIRDLESTFFYQAREDLDYQISEEAAFETAEINEYRFDNCGRPI